jgi:RimJ/RimL family protein N-acetyltransferase
MTSIIREATEEDIFDILVLAREFSKEAPETHKWNKEKTDAFLHNIIKNNNAIIFVLVKDDEVVGAIVGVVTEMFMANKIVATELAWFVSKEARGTPGSVKLIKKYEDWAKSCGADYVVLGDIKGISDLGNLYSRLGYDATETTYMKGL